MKSKKPMIIVALLILCLAAVLFGCAGSELPYSDSQTNVQVEGVDESDVVKTIQQNGFKYIAAIRNDGLTISKAVSGEITVVKKNPLTGFYNGEMLLEGNVLALIGQVDDFDDSVNNRKVEIRLYDVSGLSDPAEELPLLRTIRVAESYDNARMAARLYEGKLYLLTRPNRVALHGYDVKDSIKGEKTLDRQKPRDDSRDYKERYSAEYGAILFSLDLSDPLSSYNAAFYDCLVNDMYFSPQGVFFISNCYVTVRVPAKFLFFRIYSNKVVHFNYLFEVDKVSLKIKTLSDPIESPRWNYAIANRYSLHATSGNLFAVVCDEDTGYSVYAFDKNLKIVGRVGGVARGESLHGVTFEENYCYFVTFRNVDPLFKVDISDPKNMKVVGELTIPGFSEYLCEFNGYKIGLGFEGGSVKVSLFDVSYLQPAEINNITYRYSSTPEAMYNPRTILVSQAYNMFGFAMDGKYYVFGIENGRLVQHKVLSQNSGYEYYIKRGIIIDNYLFTLSDKEIRSYAASDFEFVGKWTLDLSYSTFTITFDSRGGTVIRPQTLAPAAYVEKPKDPVKYGYIFKGWYFENYPGGEALFHFGVNIYADYNLYALWTQVV